MKTFVSYFFKKDELFAEIYPHLKWKGIIENLFVLASGKTYRRNVRRSRDAEPVKRLKV